jgi:hypothetical protein
VLLNRWADDLDEPEVLADPPGDFVDGVNLSGASHQAASADRGVGFRQFHGGIRQFLRDEACEAEVIRRILADDKTVQFSRRLSANAYGSSR